MCEDCSAPHELTRRNFLWVPPALLAATLTSAIAERAGAAHLGQREIDGICRDAWGARPPTRSFTRHRIERLTIHHSGAEFYRNREAPERFRSMQAGHQAQGWPDIAYHVLVDRHGNVYRARPTWAKGNTNTNYNPAGHLLVMCIGNFEVQDLPRPQLRAAINVLAWASVRFDVRPRRIGGHRDYASTACPGDALYRYIANGTIERRVRRRLHEVKMNDLCGRAGRRRVRAIENGND
ncbi:MAG: peptidoglycan recognition protein family protein [Actinomycetota bacterium]|nr:peptidoglycan recognition protein family protein [Actinomycetota bacterium]